MNIQETSTSRIQFKIDGQDFYNSRLKDKIGKHPFYIPPKYHQRFLGSEPQMISESEFNSQLVIPKFNNPSVNDSLVSQNKNQNSIIPQIKKQPSQNQEQKEIKNSILFSSIQLIIWLFYFIGSMEASYGQITSFHLVDCIGNVISLGFLIYIIFSNKGLKSVTQILHIWSIILTVTILVYPRGITNISQSDLTFIKIIGILRTLRLLFPLFDTNFSIVKIKNGIMNIYKLRKILFLAIVWLFIIGVFYYQIFANSQGNRCRAALIPLTQSEILPIDNRLCGRRKCPQNYFCTNPKRVGLLLSQGQQNLRPNRKQSFSFDSSLESMFSVFQIFTLNGWGKITQTYFDIYPGYISVPVYMLGFLVFQLLTFSLILIFVEIHKEKKERRSIKPLKNKQDRFSFEIQQFAVQDIKIGMNKKTQTHQFGSIKTFAISNSKNQAHNQFQKEKIEYKQESKPLQMKKVVLYILLILYSILHYVLASQFSLDPVNFEKDFYNRKIGVSLAVFFIVHFAILNLIKFQFLGSNEEEQRQTLIETSITTGDQKNNLSDQGQKVTDTVLKFEYFIFFMNLADYILRLIDGKFILEESSGLTPFCHFLLGLRFYYIVMALIDILGLKKIQNYLMLTIKTITSGLGFSIINVILACIFGVSSFIIVNGDQLNLKGSQIFSYEINRFLMYLINHSWQGLQHKDEISSGFCIVFGSVIFMAYTVGYLINESFSQDLSVNQEEDSQPINDSQIKNDQPQKKQQESEDVKALKAQKSFYIFPYDNFLRKAALDIVNQKYYQQTIKFRYGIFCLTVGIILMCFAQKNIVRIVVVILEGIGFLDMIMTSIALRFFGPFSFTQNKILPCLDFIFTIIMLSFAIADFQFHFVPLIQITKVGLNVLNSLQGFQQTFTFIRKHYVKFLLHFLIMIPILLGLTLLSLLLMSNQNLSLSFSQKLLQSLKLSLILFTQKGWNVHRIFGNNNINSHFNQLSLSALLILWMVFSVSLFCTLTALIFSILVKQKRAEQKQMKEKLCNSDILVEQMKIRSRIKKLSPKFDYRLYGSGFMLKFCTLQVFQIVKKFSCICCFICILIVNVDLTTSQRVTVYSVHLFFFTIQMMLFLLESYCYQRNQDYFWRDLILNFLAVSGSFIGFVNPVRFSNQSYELNVILEFFNALTVLRFIKIITYFQIFSKIYHLIWEKLSKTLHTLSALLIMSTSIAAYLYLVTKQTEPFLDCLNYVFLGIMGGDFYPTIQNIIERNHIKITYEMHLLYLAVHLLTPTFNSLLLAFFIFEVSQTVKQTLPLKKNDFNLYNFNKYFHENQFLQQWKKIDPQGKGFVNFKIILNKSHLFIRHFSVSPLPYKSFYNRIQTFKKLKLQIHEAQTTYQKQDLKQYDIKKQYVVTFFDFLFSLNFFIFKEINTQKLIDKGDFFIKNQNYNQQPISLINLNVGGFELIMNGLKRSETIQKKSEQLKQKWLKQNYSLLKQLLKQRQQEHPQIEGIKSVLKLTNLRSEDIYFAYRIKGRIIKLLKQIKVFNLTKGNADGFYLKSKR